MDRLCFHPVEFRYPPSLSLFIENLSRDILETRAATGERMELNLARFDTNSSTVRNKNF